MKAPAHQPALFPSGQLRPCARFSAPRLLARLLSRFIVFSDGRWCLTR